eukprot:CAMPEP_0194337478 /NCGR_PEP_ID=MMETSP0171-20130528/76465_1 /TAXON_ID=218684 /ORGANISM="Corethron pennatum, Strain L29A3" /LENGTH=86 /DNA_ID=CAMNT_0039101275 /DNA_START=97 /DNA_END=357 /DNA_ORIENTATION=-
MSVSHRQSAERVIRKITAVVFLEHPEKTQLTSLCVGPNAPEVHRDRAPVLRLVSSSASRPHVYSSLAERISSDLALLPYKHHWGIL